MLRSNRIKKLIAVVFFNLCSKNNKNDANGGDDYLYIAMMYTVMGVIMIHVNYDDTQ